MADERLSGGLDGSGKAVFWGFIANDWADATPDEPFEQLALAVNRACGLRSDGTVRCWGEEPHEAPEGRFARIDGKGGSFLGLRHDGSVQLWGAASPTPSEIEGGPFTQISAGWLLWCAIRKEDGTIWCGGNSGRFGERNEGQFDPPDGLFVQVSAGERHACGVRPDGRIECWGDFTGGKTTPPEELQ